MPYHNTTEFRIKLYELYYIEKSLLHYIIYIYVKCQCHILPIYMSPQLLVGVTYISLESLISHISPRGGHIVKKTNYKHAHYALKRVEMQ